MVISKALAPKRVGILLCLREPAYAPKKRTIVTLILFGYIGIMYKLSSFDCSNYYVNSFRFGVFIAHFVVVVKTRFACFDAGRVLMRDIGYKVTKVNITKYTAVITVGTAR